MYVMTFTKRLLHKLPIDVCVIIAMTSLILMYYHVNNSNRDVERFYHQHARPVYNLFVASYTVIVLSLWFHVRFLISFVMKESFS